jgi:hypothetical protein
MTHTWAINVNIDASDQFTCSDTGDQCSGDTGDQCTCDTGDQCTGENQNGAIMDIIRER